MVSGNGKKGRTVNHTQPEALDAKTQFTSLNPVSEKMDSRSVDWATMVEGA